MFIHRAIVVTTIRGKIHSAYLTPTRKEAQALACDEILIILQELVPLIRDEQRLHNVRRYLQEAKKYIAMREDEYFPVEAPGPTYLALRSALEACDMGADVQIADILSSTQERDVTRLINNNKIRLNEVENIVFKQTEEVKV